MKPRQLSLLDALTPPAPAPEPRADDYAGLFEESEATRPRSLDEVPAWLRFPWEEED